MSVGIGAIRDDPQRIRQGCIDKGEDPSRVDAVLALDTQRRVLLAERDALRAERNQRAKRIGEITRELNAILARLGLEP